MVYLKSIGLVQESSLALIREPRQAAKDRWVIDVYGFKGTADAIPFDTKEAADSYFTFLKGKLTD